METRTLAKLLDDGSIKIEFAYHNGDEASSTACYATRCWLQGLITS